MKRSLVCFLSLLFAFSAFASDLSWDQIEKDSSFHATFPAIGFHYVSVSVDQLCVEGENLRPLNPFRDVCVRWEGQGEAVPTCAEYTRVRLETPVHYQAVECVEWQWGENPVCR